ncbi:MAG: hypothetical protein Phyf2KO_21830 [Phycisphaerales bacterium]
MAQNRDIKESALGATESVSIRRFMMGDSIPDITSLLHRAYARQREAGLDSLAGRQTDEVTLDRIINSESYVAFTDESERQIAGVILLNEHERVTFPEFFLREEVSHFAMFGVDPAIQAAGIGGKLLNTCVNRAHEIGSTHLALSMAEPDKVLYRYYKRRGFAYVQDWQWPYTNYSSLILAKRI